MMRVNPFQIEASLIEAYAHDLGRDKELRFDDASPTLLRARGSFASKLVAWFSKGTSLTRERQTSAQIFLLSIQNEIDKVSRNGRSQGLLRSEQLGRESSDILVSRAKELLGEELSGHRSLSAAKVLQVMQALRQTAAGINPIEQQRQVADALPSALTPTSDHSPENIGRAQESLESASVQVSSTAQSVSVPKPADPGLEDNRRSVIYDDRLRGTFVTRHDSTSEEESEQSHAENHDELDRRQAEAAKAAAFKIQSLLDEPAAGGTTGATGSPQNQSERINDVIDLMDHYRFNGIHKDAYREAVGEFARFHLQLSQVVAPVLDRLDCLLIRSEAFEQIGQCTNDITAIEASIVDLRAQRQALTVEKSQILHDLSLDSIDANQLERALQTCFGEELEPKQVKRDGISARDIKVAKLALIEAQVNAIDHQIGIERVHCAQRQADREMFSRECEANDQGCRDLWQKYQFALTTYGANGRQTIEALGEWEQAFKKLVGTEYEMLSKLDQAFSPMLFELPVGIDPVTKTHIKLLFDFKHLHELTADKRSSRSKIENTVLKELGLPVKKTDSDSANNEAAKVRKLVKQACDSIHELLEQHVECWQRGSASLAKEGILDPSNQDLRELDSLMETLIGATGRAAEEAGLGKKDDIATLVKHALTRDLKRRTKENDARYEVNIDGVKQPLMQRPNQGSANMLPSKARSSLAAKSLLNVSRPAQASAGSAVLDEGGLQSEQGAAPTEPDRFGKAQQFSGAVRVISSSSSPVSSTQLFGTRFGAASEDVSSSDIEIAYDLSMDLAKAYAALLEHDNDESRLAIQDLMRSNKSIHDVSKILAAVVNEGKAKPEMQAGPTTWLLQKFKLFKDERAKFREARLRHDRPARVKEAAKQSAEAAAIFAKLASGDIAKLRLGSSTAIESVLDSVIAGSLSAASTSAIDEAKKAWGLTNLQIRALYLYSLSFELSEREAGLAGLNLDELRGSLKVALGFPESIHAEVKSASTGKVKQAEFDPAKTFAKALSDLINDRSNETTSNQLERVPVQALDGEKVLPAGFKAAFQKEMNARVAQQRQDTSKPSSSSGPSGPSGVPRYKAPSKAGFVTGIPRYATPSSASVIAATVVMFKNLSDGIKDIASHVLLKQDAEALRDKFDQVFLGMKLSNNLANDITKAVNDAAQELSEQARAGPKEAQKGLVLKKLSEIKTSTALAMWLNDLDAGLLPLFLGRLYPALAAESADPGQVDARGLTEMQLETVVKFERDLNEVLDAGYDLDSLESGLPEEAQEALKQGYKIGITKLLSITKEITSEVALMRARAEVAGRIQSGTPLEPLAENANNAQIELQVKAIEEAMQSAEIQDFFRVKEYGEHYTHLIAFLDQCGDRVQKMERKLEAGGLLRQSKHRSEFIQERDSLHRLSNRIDHMRKVVTELGMDAAERDENVV